MENIEDILKSINNEILTEEVKTSIANSFNEAVETKVQAQAALLTENELNKMDADHSAKLDKLVEAIDKDHTNKFKQVIQKLDESHTAKLKQVISKYERELQEGAESLRSELVSKVSNYLDLYITESIPTAQLKEAVENIRARKMMDEIKKIVAVDPEFISENFKAALKDGHDTIERLRGELNTSIKESVDINQSFLNTKSELLMERLTKDLPANKKKFVVKLLEGKKPEEIEANFKYVVEMYDNEDSERSSSAAESAKGKTTTLTNKVDAPKSVITENNIQPREKNAETEGVASYLEELGRPNY